MRLLMNVWEWPPHHSGGLGIAAASLAGALARRGVDVLAHARHGPAPGRTLFDGGGSLELRVSGTSSGRPVSAYSGNELADDVRAYARATQAIARSERFDLVHAHDWLSFPGGLAARAVSGRPFLAHVHSLAIDRAGGAPERVPVEVERIEAAGLAVADRVLCVSETSAREVARRHPVAGRVRVVPCGVAWAPEASRWAPKDPPLVLFVGRMTYQKAPDRFLAAARRVIEAHPLARFALLGDGEGLGPLAMAVQRSGLGRRVAFPGWQERGRCLEWMQRASVVVMPSRREPFGLVALEAAVRGVPVVLDPCCGVLEGIPSAVSVDSGDPGLLSRAILASLDDPESARVLARRVAAEAEQLTWPRSAERLHEVYRELCP